MAGGNAISSLRGSIGTDLAAERFSCILKVPDIYVYSVSCNLYDTYVGVMLLQTRNWTGSVPAYRPYRVQYQR